MKKTPTPKSAPPLSEHALDVLRDIAYSPVPAQTINPGVIARLQRDELIEFADLPSPFPTHQGRSIQFARITAKGRGLLFPPDASDRRTASFLDLK